MRCWYRSVTNPPLISSLFVLSLMAVSLGLAEPLGAGDWPQLLGPHRNGQATEELAGESYNPRELWATPLGQGYSGPVVVGRYVVVFHRVDDVERAEAFDRDTGRQLWKTDFEASYRGGYDPLGDLGPRATPVVHEGRVYVMGAAGALHSLDLTTGKRRWSRDLYIEYGAPEGYFGAGSTPIVAADNLLVNIGGRGAGIVALELDSGRTRWKATDEQASYSSPTQAQFGGREQVVFVTRYNVVSLDPRSGELLFRFPFGQRGPTVNAATPLVIDDEYLFVSSSYGVGARLVRVRTNEGQEVWSSDEVMSSQYTTCVYHDGYLYGTDGRSDVGVGTLRCLQAKSGKVQWSQADFGVAHILLAGKTLIIVREDGKVFLAAASPAEFKPIHEFEASEQTVRALPAFSDGRLYVHDTNGRSGALKCWALK